MPTSGNGTISNYRHFEHEYSFLFEVKAVVYNLVGHYVTSDAVSVGEL